MTRSVWKGPFVDGYLLRRRKPPAASAAAPGHQDLARRSTILPQFVGLTFQVHNGNKFIPVLVSEEWLATSSANSRPPGPSMVIRGDKKAEK